MARVNKATRRQRGFRQLGLRGTFEKTTSYTLCPARSQLSVLQDGDTLEKKLGRGVGCGGQGRNRSHRCSWLTWPEPSPKGCCPESSAPGRAGRDS